MTIPRRIAAAILALFSAVSVSAQMSFDSGGVPLATETQPGRLSLGGDLGGTAASPQVDNDSHDHGASTISGLDAADTTTGRFTPARLLILSADCEAETAPAGTECQDTDNGIKSHCQPTSGDCDTAPEWKASDTDTDQQNIFLTIDVPTGTDAVADSANDTLGLTGSGIVSITGLTNDIIEIGATETDPGVPLLALADYGDPCAASQAVRRNSGDTANECYTPLGTPTLGTDTNGNYVASIACGAGVTGCVAAAEGAVPTLAASLGTDIATGEIVDATIAQVDIDDTQTIGADPANGAGSVWFGTTGLIAEGSSSDTSETLFTFANPTADRTVTVPDATGTLCVGSTACAVLEVFEGAVSKGVLSTLTFDETTFDVTGDDVALGASVSLLGQTIAKAETTGSEFVFTDQANVFGLFTQTFRDALFKNAADATILDINVGTDNHAAYTGLFTIATDLATKANVDAQQAWSASLTGAFNTFATQRTFIGTNEGGGISGTRQIPVSACTTREVRAKLVNASGAAFNVPTGNRLDVFLRRNDAASGQATVSIAAAASTGAGTGLSAPVFAAGDTYQFSTQCVNVGSACSDATTVFLQVYARCAS